MPVNDSSDRIGDRIIHVIALHEDRRDGSDTAATDAGTGTLEESRKECENRWCVATGGWWLAGSKPNLPLRHRQSCETVDHQHDLGAVITEILRNAERGLNGLHQQDWRTI